MLPEGGWPLAAARAAADASLLSLFGALVLHAAVAPAGLRVARWSAAAAAAALPAWLVAESVNLGGSLAAAPDVLLHTAYGHLVAGSWACALVALAATGPGWRLAVALAAAGSGLLLQAGHSHAAAMQPGISLLLASTALHELAAGAWLGGLLPLARFVRAAPLPAASLAVRRYSVLGIACVLALAGTAAWQSSLLVGGLAGWVGTEYGRVALAKLALLAALVAIAALNRQALAPALAGRDPARARRRLGLSITVETGLGLLVVSAAALLTSLEPAMHQQPAWPFAVQPSLVTVNEDPDFRWEVIEALGALAAASAVLAAAVARRRFRIPAAAAAAAVAWFALPHLDLLFIPAYPTSFFRSPTAFAATSIVHGAALYPPHCAACHGADGQGNGPAAASLPVPPADLTAEHLWMHPDGEMFWWLSHGIEAPEGGLAMPGFADALSEDDRWALIDYVRAHNAGLVRHATGHWSPPLQAPELDASCPDGRTLSLADLRGRAVRLAFPGAAAPPPLDDALAVTITVGETEAGCAATDPAVRQAYAAVLGIPDAALAGMTVLVDPNGWLRSEEPSAVSPALLAELVRQICGHPLALASGGHHHAE